MLNVAIIIERAEIGLGGAERSISELATELRSQGVMATILAAKGTPSENVQILCNQVSGKRVSLKQFEQAIQAHLRDHRYDIIHSTLPLAGADIYQPRGGSYKEAMLQNIASYCCPAKRCLKRWTHFLNTRRTEYIKAEEKICNENKTTVAALSGYVEQQFQKHYHLPEKRIAVIPNGIHTDLEPDLKAADDIKETIFRKLSVAKAQQPVLFLFAANNPRLKGLRELLVSLGQLTKVTEAYPVLVVAGTKGLGHYEKIISQHGLEKHVISLGPQNGIANVLSVCDAAVLPTYYDPCSRFILEALAMGKPVITTRFNGAAERYQHLRHGMIIDRPDNLEDLTNALLHFCDHGKIDLASKAIVDDNLRREVSITQHAEKLVGLYETILNQRNS